MNTKLIEDVAAAVLYEGYLLYPYRASAIKNKQRWTFGVLYPREYAEQQSGADAWSMQTDCLVRATPESIPEIRVRFLHLIERNIDGKDWQAAMEREIVVTGVPLSEMITGSEIRTVPFHPEEKQEPIEVVVETTVRQIRDDVYQIRAAIFNTTRQSAPAIMQSLVSTHTILTIDHGEFISLLEPPDDLREFAAGCKNSGTWPVLAGEEGQRDAMLSSPIILYDYPRDRTGKPRGSIRRHRDR